MKKTAFLIASICFTMATFSQSIQKMAENIQWLGQATVRIQNGESIVYIDPYQIEKPEKADIILISHAHSDHFSPKDIAMLCGENTIIVFPTSMDDTAKTLKIPYVLAKPYEISEIKSIQIEPVPAYNVVKDNFHPKSNQWLGYIITIDNVRIYHTGDTERIPEMKTIRTDIVLIPLGQTYTMNSVNEAAACVEDVGAKIAIPIHYGLYEGTNEDALKFKELLKGKVDVMVKNLIK